MYRDRKAENTILYYPTINIEDSPWLRNAVLYWDKVSSIVPSSNYCEPNSVEVEYLWGEGLYEPIYPFALENDQKLCEEFCKQVKKNIRRRKNGFSTSGSRSRVHIDKMKIPNENVLHIDKTPNNIIDFLLEEGIAQKNCEGPWIGMHAQDANIYMATLARYLAKAVI